MDPRATKPETPGGQLFEVAMLAIQATFCLRAAGKAIAASREGESVSAVSHWGGGAWGLMRSLVQEGPQTVPALARARPVSRQRIQKLADELAAAGLVRFQENQAHKRSRLLVLTPAGEAVYASLTEKIEGWFDGLARDLDATPEEMETAARVLSRLVARIAP